MITQEPTKETLAAWKATWALYGRKLRPNRKSGSELLEYLRSRYPLTEILDRRAADVVSGSVTANAHLAEKLPEGASPLPKAFYLENAEAGTRFYIPENQDPPSLWGEAAKRIFVGIDLASGYYTVEGCSLLWDELCAFQGVDEKDLQNYVIVAQYIGALKRLNKLNEVIGERPEATDKDEVRKF